MYFVCKCTVCWTLSLMSVLHTLEHAHTRPACPSDLSHTHPRNYGERTGRCQRGEAGAVFYPLQVGDYTGADVDSRPALEKTLLVQYFIICSYLTQSPPPPPRENEMFAPEVSLWCCHGASRARGQGCGLVEVKNHSHPLTIVVFTHLYVAPHRKEHVICNLVTQKAKWCAVFTQKLREMCR